VLIHISSIQMDPYMYGGAMAAAPLAPSSNTLAAGYYGVPMPAAQPPMPVQSSPDTKLFVGGVLTTTTSATLGAYFAQFGSVVEARIVMDRVTGRSKGYAFVTFADVESAARAAAPGIHMIEGKACNTNLVSQKDQAMAAYQSDPANAAKRSFNGDGESGGDSKRRRTEGLTSSANFGSYSYPPSYPGWGPAASSPGAPSPYAPYPGMAPVIPSSAGFYPAPLAGRPGDPKIFVGGIAPTTTEDSLAHMLSIFGDISESKVLFDREKNETKGVAFVTFVDPAAAVRAATCGVLFIEGRRCTTNLSSAKQSNKK